MLMSLTLQSFGISFLTYPYFSEQLYAYVFPAKAQPPQSLAAGHLFFSAVWFSEAALFFLPFTYQAPAQLSTTCLRRTEVVTEPTPPGTGVTASAISEALS